MKKLLILLTITTLLFLSNIKAQEVAPLQLGNIWVYDYTTSLGRITVIDTSVSIDTTKYHQTKWQANYGGLEGYELVRLKEDGYYAIREDTSYQASNHEKLYYKKDAVIGDTWENPAPYFPLIYTVLDTFVTTVFGISQTVKHLEIDGSLVLFNEYWTEKFGWLSRSDFGGTVASLQGCVIDGTVYGDTTFTVVSVEDEFAQPENFYLKQNYPNPFNSSTNVKYAIGSRQNVSLVVYDVLGNEVAVLIKEEKPTGEYEIKFNSGRLASGIYIYRLKTNGKIISKKMILIK